MARRTYRANGVVSNATEVWLRSVFGIYSVQACVDTQSMPVYDISLSP